MTLSSRKIRKPTYKTTINLLLLLLMVSVCRHCSAKPNQSPSDASAEEKIVTVKLFTNILRPLQAQNYEREIEIYLPADYVGDVAGLKKFPVLYLLHGSPGMPSDFSKNGHWPDLLEQAAKNDDFAPPILVAPNGNYSAAAFGDSEWLNSADGQNRFEDFIVDQVVPWVDKHYRTVANPQGRVIGGVSEGGYGAVNIALHHPELFGSVIALSGYYVNDGSGWARRIMGHNKEFLDYNSPLTILDSPALVTKWLTAWQTQRYFIGSGLNENRYTIESRELDSQFHQRGIASDLYQVDGKHGWELWNALFTAALAYIFSPDQAAVTNSSQPYKSPS